MKLRRVALRHFRRLKRYAIDLEDHDTSSSVPITVEKHRKRCFSLGMGKGSFFRHDFRALVDDIDPSALRIPRRVCRR